MKKAIKQVSKKWYIPRNTNDDKHEASLLELFFDLVFVAFIGGFVHRVEHNFEHGFDGFEFTFMFMSLITIVIVWRSFTVYSSRYEDDYNFRHRLMTFLIMVGLGIITTGLFLDFGNNGDDHFKKVIKILSVGYSLVFGTLLWLMVAGAIKAENKYESKRLWLNSAGIFSASIISTVAIMLNIFTDSTTLHWVAVSVIWPVSLVSWLILDLMASTSTISVNTPDVSLKHIQERFGIIFIVFIGESLIQTIAGSSEKVLNDTIPTIGKLIAVFAILFAWWWWYNDTISYPDVIEHPRRISLFKLSFMFILVSLAISAVGFAGIIKHPDADYSKYILASAMIVWSVGNSLMYIAQKDYNAKDKIVFPKILRIMIYAMPIYATVVFHFGYYDFVSSKTLFWLIFGISLSLIPSSILMIIAKRFIEQRSNKSIELVIKEYEIKEDEWIKKYALPRIDEEIHKKYDYKLNHYSKYIKR